MREVDSGDGDNSIGEMVGAKITRVLGGVSPSSSTEGAPGAMVEVLIRRTRTVIGLRSVVVAEKNGE